MKKMFTILLAVLMLLSMTACGGDQGNEDGVQEITGAAGGNDDGNVSQNPENGDEYVYAFTYEGVELIPGQAFDATALPEPDSVYTVPSCAVEGTDNVYTYGGFELTAYDEGNGEHIYSIYFVDPNLPTNEGLALGDSLSTAFELYGLAYVQDGSSYTYTLGNTQLILLVDGETIISIEFRLNNG